jgi:uncharacterized iron-regulated membrane protein
MSVIAPGTRWYNAVWRWHFYAGLICIPFILCLSITGSIYLWKPQIEAQIDRPYAHVTMPGQPRATAAAITRAAQAAVPGSMLHRYQLPDTPDQAVQVIVSRQAREYRVYVHPQTLDILKTAAEDQRLMRLVFRLHGELLIGDLGSWIVETAACWAIMMILTGLYLWWPRGTKGLGGVLWPRLHRGGRGFWRDIHAVAGIWIGFLGLALILTGLPWANVWGGYLKEVRTLTGATDGPQDWSTSSHEGHQGMTMAHVQTDDTPLDRIIANVAPLHLAGPVLIAPPTRKDGLWTARSDAGDRPLRVNLTIDGASGTIVKRDDFAERHWIDRAVGYGVAGHEGQLFGLANQLLSMVAAIGLILLAISGAILWWRRRPVGLLGAPLPLGRPRFGPLLIGAILVLAVIFPMFGGTLIMMLLTEHLLLRRCKRIAQWLGLRILQRNTDGLIR